MIDDTGDELLEGFWPFVKRILFLFVPLWVYFLCFTAGLPRLYSSIIAGSSLAGIIAFERYKLSQENTDLDE